MAAARLLRKELGHLTDDNLALPPGPMVRFGTVQVRTLAYLFLPLPLPLRMFGGYLENHFSICPGGGCGVCQPDFLYRCPRAGTAISGDHHRQRDCSVAQS